MEISIKKLYLIVFFTGAIVMVLELIGSRILAPKLGTSIFVWTSLIGIILGAMSLGYYLGGKLADKDPKMKTLSIIIFISGIFVFLIVILKSYVLETSVVFGLRLGSIYSSIILFAVPGILLGSVSPYAVRLSMENVEKSGKTVGNLYAISTFGSIVGTFFSGFYLIPSFGSTNILYGLSLSLFLLSIFGFWEGARIKQTIAIAFVLFGCSSIINANENKQFLVDEDSAYNHIRVYDIKNDEGKALRVMSVENFFDSGMFLDSDELVFAYSKYFRLDDVFNKNIKKAVVFGGAAYSTPKDYLMRKKDGSVDVVEIDPKTTEIAEKYFRLDTNDERLRIFHEDARMFLNRTGQSTEKYDVVYNDAFNSSCTMPFHMTTREAVAGVYDILNDDGIYILNIVSGVTGENSDFFRAEYKTINEKFAQVYAFPIRAVDLENSGNAQNIVLVATKKKVDMDKIIGDNQNGPVAELLSHMWKYKIETDDLPILTDDYAPVNFYTSKFCES